MREPPKDSQPAGPTVVVPGKLHGVRTWEIDTDYSGVMRLSGIDGTQWQASGETTSAQCQTRGTKRRSSHSSPAPAGDCECGLYGLHPWRVPRDVRLQNWPVPGWPLSAIGLVEIWGTVQLHMQGFRAQYGRPVGLALIYIPLASQYGRLIAQIAEVYEAEVLEFESVSGLSDYCRAAGLGMSEETVRSLLNGTEHLPSEITRRYQQ